MQDRHGNTDSTLRGLLSRLFGGWGTNNAAGASTNPYFRQPQQPPPSMPMAPTDSQAQAIADTNASGPMNDATLPQFAPPMRHRRGPPPGAPAGTLGGMPITEGQNANIGDDSRQRALDMVAALRRGGAL